MSDAPSLAFETPAGNLHPGDADRFDIFVRDLASSATALASRAGGAGGAKGDADSRVPSISANGRRVAFESTLGNLASPDTNAFNDIFVRDLQASTTTLASVAADGTPANGLGMDTFSLSLSLIPVGGSAGAGRGAQAVDRGDAAPLPRR
jgi:hypothetical protein